jgi:hypothetical protein
LITEQLLAKEELIHWITDLKNEYILAELLSIKEKLTFQEKMNSGMSSDEARRKSIDFLKLLNWKKQ